MTHLEIAEAKRLGFQPLNTPYGRILWRRQHRCMTIVFQTTGDEHEEDLDQEPRLDLPAEDDRAGNRAWAELLAENYADA